MAPHNDLQTAASDFVRVLIPRRDIDRLRRVEQAINSAGKPILDGNQFIPILSTPGNKPMRLRVDDNGNVYVNEAPTE